MYYDVIIIGAGAAGLMCAATAAQRGRSVLLLDHANKAGKKILMSGGGRCNFTNYYADDSNYLSHNPHFCKSALSRYTQWDFIAQVDKHGIAYHEKKDGQLFCDHSAKDILNMLLDECTEAGALVQLNTAVEAVSVIDHGNAHVHESDNQSDHKSGNKSGGYRLDTQIKHKGEVARTQSYRCESLVIASGGLSIPTLGATGFGFQLAEQFGLNTHSTRAGLVPLTITDHLKTLCTALSGSACEVNISCDEQSFRGDLLFTHRGLSGPVVLQISSYWQAGSSIEIDLLPNIDLAADLRNTQHQRPKLGLKKYLSQWLTQKMAEQLVELWCVPLLSSSKESAKKAEKSTEITLASLNAEQMDAIGAQFHRWRLVPSGTEGYRTAEVTLGGVDSDELSSKTLESHRQKGLYFIGEVVDVSGQLGGFNFQWAWASGWAAAQYV